MNRIAIRNTPKYRAKDNERQKARRERRDPKYLAMVRTRASSPEQKAKKRAWAKTETGQRSILNSQLKVKFGITLARFEEMVKEQNGVCAICKRPPADERLCVDHCHTTGKVRGLLCQQCNHAIGLLRDDPDAMRAAAGYIEEQNTYLFARAE